MKDLTYDDVSPSGIDGLLIAAADAGALVDTFEGVLNDVHIIHADKKIRVGRAKPREFIVCYYKYQNMWSNTLHVLLTDDYDKAAAFIPDSHVRCDWCGVFEMRENTGLIYHHGWEVRCVTGCIDIC